MGKFGRSSFRLRRRQFRAFQRSPEPTPVAKKQNSSEDASASTPKDMVMLDQDGKFQVFGPIQEEANSACKAFWVKYPEVGAALDTLKSVSNDYDQSFLFEVIKGDYPDALKEFSESILPLKEKINLRKADKAIELVLTPFLSLQECVGMLGNKSAVEINSFNESVIRGRDIGITYLRGVERR